MTRHDLSETLSDAARSLEDYGDHLDERDSLVADIEANDAAQAELNERVRDWNSELDRQKDHLARLGGLLRTEPCGSALLNSLEGLGIEPIAPPDESTPAPLAPTRPRRAAPVGKPPARPSKPKENP